MSINCSNFHAVATIYDVDEADCRKFLTLEFIAGGTLKSKVKGM